MHVVDFEELARVAPETVTLELRGGRLVVKPPPDGNHSTILVWLTQQCHRQRPELGLYPFRGLKVGLDHLGRARPDGTLAPRRHFAGHGHWSDPEGVVMTVEITHHSLTTDHRDRHEMRDSYAAANIPTYLLVDREAAALKVYTDPGHGTYHRRVTHAFGATVTLPDPVAITLDTDELKNYAR
ncbi:Uma2 family endonuclease [Streptomyces niveus]|uniref:Uma2 family endonuclease n=1 Tax=Streptomyces niveus TaxID=193462 RepID=UPI00365F85F5